MSDRKVSTDALETLGTILVEGEERDAVHLAVAPVVAGEQLWPGDHVNVQDGLATKSGLGKGIGIVDPFLTVRVNPGDRFWFVMYPRKVTSLRHVWTHPSFDGTAKGEDEREQHRVAIQAVADAAGLTFDEMIEAARDHAENGEFLCEGSRWDGFSIEDAFWDHYEGWTGKKVHSDNRGNIFSCGC